MTNNELISRIYEQHTELNNKQSNQEMDRRLDQVFTDYIQMSTGTLKDSQHFNQRCANQNPQKDISHVSKWLLSKSLQIANIGEDMEKRAPLYTVEKMQIDPVTKKNSLEFLQNTKNRTTI